MSEFIKVDDKLVERRVEIVEKFYKEDILKDISDLEQRLRFLKAVLANFESK